MHDRLGIDQDLPFQQRGWGYLRLVWSVCSFVSIGARPGLFGQGSPADASMVDVGGTVRSDYERLARFERLTYLTVSSSAAPAADVLDVRWDRPYAEAFVLRRPMPLPARSGLQKNFCFDFQGSWGR